MNYFITVLFLVILGNGGVLATTSLSCARLIDATDGLIGSGGLGFGYGGLNPGAGFPYSPFRLGPDTQNSSADVAFQHFSGYFYGDDTIRSFSHTHFAGAGINGLGAIGLMPMRSNLGDDKWAQTVAGEEGNLSGVGKGWTAPWWATMDKSSEAAHAGFYTVRLEEPAYASVSLLATSTLSGVHKYEWDPETTRDLKRYALLDVTHTTHLEDELAAKNRPQQATLTVSRDGKSFSAGVLGGEGYWTYLHGEVMVGAGERPSPTTWSVCVGDDCSVGNGKTLNADDGARLVARFSLDHESDSTEIHVGLSFISTEVASDNLHSVARVPFAEALERTKQVWCDELSGLVVEPLENEGAHAEQLVRMITTAHFRSHMYPPVYSESNGQYMGFDGQSHSVVEEREAAGYIGTGTRAMQFFSDFSLWDTFRTQGPWQLLTQESLFVGILRSLGEITEQQRAFPKWTTASAEKGCMVGTPGAAMVLEGCLAGMEKEFDIVGIQQSLQTIATEPGAKNGRVDVDFYLEHGYVSVEAAGKAASLTLSYAFDDFLLAGISDVTSNTDDASAARARAQNYRNIWSAENELMCPKSDNGTLVCPHSASPDWWNAYTEGNAWHWTFFVPHDPEGLRELFTDEGLDSRLDAYFREHVPVHDKFGAVLPNPFYWAGNEENFLHPFLWNYLPGRCHKTQYWIRKVIDMHFSDTAAGLPGNDDYASMSTFLLWSSIGLFPVAGTGSFHIGSPSVSSARDTVEVW